MSWKKHLFKLYIKRKITGVIFYFDVEIITQKTAYSTQNEISISIIVFTVSDILTAYYAEYRKCKSVIDSTVVEIILLIRIIFYKSRGFWNDTDGSNKLIRFLISGALSYRYEYRLSLLMPRLVRTSQFKQRVNLFQVMLRISTLYDISKKILA